MSKKEALPDLMLEMMLDVTRACAAHGVENSKAVLIGRSAARNFCRKWGGSSAYIPKGKALDVIDKHLAIYAEFDGKNYRELGIKYDLTEMAVRNAIKKVQKAKNSA